MAWAQTVQTQACCSVQGSCADLAPADCLNLGGIPGGAGTSCLGNPSICTERPCCLSSGQCIPAVSPLHCQAHGGTPQPIGSQCPPNGVCAPQECAPTPDRTRCQQVNCPNNGQKCSPSKVRVNLATGQIEVLDCDCQDNQFCHLVQVSGALPDCSGPCPTTGTPCERIITQTPTGLEIECRCGGCGDDADCDDHNACTKDSCDPATGQCIHIPKNCNDGNACTDDRCDPQTGNCIHVTKNCDDNDACTTDSCNPNTGQCSHLPKVCVDLDPCTKDYCDPATGQCRYDPIDCNDNNPCTIDKCEVNATGGVICTHTNICEACCFPSGAPCQNLPPGVCQQQGGVPRGPGTNCAGVDCPQPNLCGPTTDRHSCKPVTCPLTNQQCLPTAIIVHPTLGIIVLDCLCRDAERCHVKLQPGVAPSCEGGCPNNPNQRCQPLTTQLPDGGVKLECICRPCTDADCNDNDPCTKDICNPDTGLCEHLPMDCDDKDLCTRDYCVNGECKHDPLNCDDNDPCTEDRCNPNTGACEHRPKDCSDNNPCTKDYCVDGVCKHDPVSCDDNDPCTADGCLPTVTFPGYLCIHTPKNCDDQDPCTKDYCVQGECKHDPIDCDDNDPCTLDSCVPDPVFGFICQHIRFCEACCLPNDPCQDLPPDVCKEKGGQPQGPGTDCAHTECKEQSVPKFSQLPTPEREDIASNISFNSANLVVNKVVADDFRSDGRLITQVRWWGSYLNKLYVPPQFNEPNAPPNHGQTPFAIDGWFISFHRPLNGKQTVAPRPPLGLYFAPASAVRITPVTGLAPCDGHPVYEYLVNLKHCCLIQSYPDTRLPATAPDYCPAKPDGFHEHHCFRYHLDIQAVIGSTWMPGAGAFCCTRIPTNNFAEVDFWGWHATANERNVAPALVSKLTVGPAPIQTPCPPLNQCPPTQPALYGPWKAATEVCPFPHRINMAFELLTNNPVTPPPCPGLVIVSATSLKDHGTPPNVTTYGINLPLDPPSSAGIECRRGGVTRVQVKFSEPIMADDESLDPGDEVKASLGTITGLNISGEVLTVDLANVPEASCLQLVIENGEEGITTLGSDVLVGDNDVHARSLTGDTNGTGSVNILDMQVIKNNLNQPLSSQNFKNDVTLNGTINILDLQATKNNFAKTAVCP